jgi:hypothetical protein
MMFFFLHIKKKLKAIPPPSSECVDECDGEKKNLSCHWMRLNVYFLPGQHVYDDDVWFCTDLISPLHFSLICLGFHVVYGKKHSSP